MGEKGKTQEETNRETEMSSLGKWADTKLGTGRNLKKGEAYVVGLVCRYALLEEKKAEMLTVQTI